MHLLWAFGASILPLCPVFPHITQARARVIELQGSCFPSLHTCSPSDIISEQWQSTPGTIPSLCRLRLTCPESVGPWLSGRGAMGSGDPSCCGCTSTTAHTGLEGHQKGRAHHMSLHTGNLILLVVKVAFPLGTLRPRILPASVSENTM